MRRTSHDLLVRSQHFPAAQYKMSRKSVYLRNLPVFTTNLQSLASIAILSSNWEANTYTLPNSLEEVSTDG